jgi:sigma-B regulation protein RsbU (phosphoserine phosphatase)
MIQTVLYSAKRVIRAESASLFLVDEKTGELYFEIIAGNKKDLKGFRIPRGQGIAGITAATKKSLIVNDAQNDARVFRQVDQVSREITRNILAAPLLIEGEAIGVIEVINTIDRPAFSEHDLEIFESFSDSVAIALQRRRLLDSIQRTNVQLERRLREITSLHAVARAQVEERTIQDLFARALNIVRDDLKVGRASILMASGSTLKMAASAGTYDESDATPGSLAHHVFSTNRPVFIEDFRENPEFAAMANPHRYDSRSCIILPLASPGQPPFGVLCLAEPSSGQFLEEDYKLLLTIASQIVKGYEGNGDYISHPEKHSTNKKATAPASGSGGQIRDGKNNRWGFLRLLCAHSQWRCFLPRGGCFGQESSRCSLHGSVQFHSSHDHPSGNRSNASSGAGK